MAKPAMPAIDLFCGCGGISEGLRIAGYDVRAGLDIDRKYIAAFRHNFPQAKAITADILSVPPDELAAMLSIERGELDLLAGGPPCQGFPDTFEFVGSYLEQAGQLGNAVPPLLAAAVVSDLQRQLRTYCVSSISKRRSKESLSVSAGMENVMA